MIVRRQTVTELILLFSAVFFLSIETRKTKGDGIAEFKYRRKQHFNLNPWRAVIVKIGARGYVNRSSRPPRRIIIRFSGRDLFVGHFCNPPLAPAFSPISPLSTPLYRSGDHFYSELVQRDSMIALIKISNDIVVVADSSLIS